MSKYRILEKLYGNEVKFFPQYYHKSFFGKWFSGWKTFQRISFSDIGSEYDDVFFGCIEDCKKYIETKKLRAKTKVVYEE